MYAGNMKRTLLSILKETDNHIRDEIEKYNSSDKFTVTLPRVLFSQTFHQTLPIKH